jgi:recombination protein U
VRVMASNRGKTLEDMINQTNLVYEKKGLAVIRKIPTPWKVQRKYSPYTKTYQIAFAYPEAKSSVDFGGTACNQSIWFDVKETKLKTSFPLGNIHDHQIDYLKKVHEQGGKAFLLIHSEHFTRTWLVWIDVLLHFMRTEKRKSLPFDWLDINCPIVQSKHSVILDYLPEVLNRKG